MRLKALVTATTHNTVSGNPTNQGSEWEPKISGRSRTRIPPAKSIARGDRLHGKLQIRTCAAEIVVDAETKNQAGRNIDAEKRGGSESIDQAGKYQGEPQPQAQADRESQENRYAPQTGKRGLVDMPSVSRHGNPASAGCQVSHFTRSHKRQSQRERE